MLYELKTISTQRRVFFLNLFNGSYWLSLHIFEWLRDWTIKHKAVIQREQDIMGLLRIFSAELLVHLLYRQITLLFHWNTVVLVSFNEIES